MFSLRKSERKYQSYEALHLKYRRRKKSIDNRGEADNSKEKAMERIWKNKMEGNYEYLYGTEPLLLFPESCVLLMNVSYDTGQKKLLN